MLYKGIIHVHSNYSYDGQHSLEEIAKLGVERGYSFIGMSEHSDTLSEENMVRYVKECEKSSASGCLMIPGIEFTCENDLHFVGLGVRHYTSAKDPVKVAEFIHQQNGIGIMAHPIRYNYSIPPYLAGIIDGIEVWNAGYDGRFVPNGSSLNFLKDLRSHHKKLLAFGSQDLHRITNQPHVQLLVSCDRLGEEEILEALKEGRFTFSNPYFELDPRREQRWWKLAQFTLGRRIYTLAKRIRDRLGW